MSRISLAALANTKSGAALGGAPGSIEPAQIKTNNQRTKLDKAMPVRTLQPYLVAAPCKPMQAPCTRSAPPDGSFSLASLAHS